MLKLNIVVFFPDINCSLLEDFITVKMEAVGSSEIFLATATVRDVTS